MSTQRAAQGVFWWSLFKQKADVDGSFRGPGHIDSGKREPLTGQFKRLEKKKGGRDQGYWRRADIGSLSLLPLLPRDDQELWDNKSKLQCEESWLKKGEKVMVEASRWSKNKPETYTNCLTVPHKNIFYTPNLQASITIDNGNVIKKKTLFIPFQ